MFLLILQYFHTQISVICKSIYLRCSLLSKSFYTNKHPNQSVKQKFPKDSKNLCKHRLWHNCRWRHFSSHTIFLQLSDRKHLWSQRKSKSSLKNSYLYYSIITVNYALGLRIYELRFDTELLHLLKRWQISRLRQQR